MRNSIDILKSVASDQGIPYIGAAETDLNHQWIVRTTVQKCLDIIDNVDEYEDANVGLRAAFIAIRTHFGV